MNLCLETFNRKEVLQYLRWTGTEIPPEVDNLIDSCMEETLRVSEPRFTYRIFSIDRQAKTPELVFTGQDVPLMLTDCDRVVLMAATLGNGLELAIRRAQVRDMARAVVLDCCGSAAIEAVCDAAEQEILAAVGASVYLTDRFSPGYGDLPISLQDTFLRQVDAHKQIGLTVTATNILTPRKSVTAIIGLANQPQSKRFRGCAYCSMFETCAFRKAGKTCGRE